MAASAVIPATAETASPHIELVSAKKSQVGVRFGLVAVVFFLTGLLAARRPTSITGVALWGEDGRIFLQDWLASNSGLLNALGLIWEPYMAQLWPVQRVLTAAISQLPASWWAPTTYWVSCFVAAASISIILQRRAKWAFGGFKWRLGIALALVLVPGVTTEIQGNLANIHWYLALGVLVTLVLPAPRGIPGRIAELLFVGIVALTGVLGIMLAPVALWLLVGRGLSATLRCRYTVMRSLVVVLGAIANLWLLSSDSRGVGRPLSGLVDPEAWEEGLSRYAGSLVMGADISGDRPLLPGLFLALVLLAAIVAMAAFDVSGPSPWWLLSGIMVAAGGLFGGVYVLFDDVGWALAPRYASILVFASILVIGRSLASGSSPAQITAGLTVLLMMGAVSTGFRLAPLQPSPTTEDVRQFQMCLDAGEDRCVLPTAPAGWTVSAVPKN